MNISKSSDLISKIVLLKEHNSKDTKRHYRFSDVINHQGYYWRESIEFILNQDHLKNTVLRNYIERCPDKNLTQVNRDKFKLLYDIIQTKITEENYLLPQDDELVIHLRTGDVVELGWYLQKDYIEM